MGISVRRIKDSIEIIRCNRTRLRRRLLVKLARQHPEMRTFFATGSRGKVISLFDSGLEAILHYFEHPVVAEQKLAEICDELPPLDFPPSVRLALPTLLLTTVAETFGPRWDSDLAFAWGEALDRASMLFDDTPVSI